MIITGTRQRFEGGLRIIRYERNETGRCVPCLRPPETEAEIDIYYEQRDIDFKRLHGELCAGVMSPVGFFAAYFNMSPKDIAPMVGLSESTVGKHMSPRGFEKATIEILKRYARVFDISVADLFSFVFLHGDLDHEVHYLADRLMERVDVNRRPSQAQ
ncbi:MAG: helix-turn-helix transcriptional regulator [Deltaproteobacteria bacterium]|nr:helix-turn-helix transcriptional regulator [Deltaproteobacteria bacterium]